MALLNYFETSRSFVWTSENYFGTSHFYDVQDYLHDTDLDEVQEFRGVVDSASVADYSTEFQEFAEFLMEKDGLEPPSS